MRPKSAGRRLRELREHAGLTLADVQTRTQELARLRRDPRLRVPRSRLCEIETNGRTPSIYCLFSLAQAYDVDVRRLLGFYGLR